ncbi:MAG: CHAT domain-containing protein [Cytophagales bacterium]
MNGIGNYRFLFLIVLLSTCIFDSALAKNNKIKKAFQEIAYLHIVGDNFEAIDELEKLNKRIEKKSKQIFVDQCYWNLMMARCHAALGQFSKAEDYLNAGKSLYKKELPAGGKEEIRVLRYLGEYYMDNQHYLNVENYLNRAMHLAEKQNPVDSFLIYELQLEKLEARMAKGQLLDIKPLYDSLYDYYASRAVKKITYFDEKKGKYKTIKLKKHEYLARVSRVADFKNLLAEYYIERGDYTTADTLLESNHRYIKSNLSKTTNVFIDHLINQAKYYDGIGDYRDSYLRWDDVINISRRSGDDNYVKDSPEVLSAYESMILVLLKDGRFALAREKIKSFENSLSTVLRYRNIYQNKIDHLKVLMAAFEQNWPLAKRDLQNIIRDTVTVPTDHPERIKYLETYYKISLKLEELDQADKYLKELLYTSSHSFGETSPIYYRLQLISADFHLNTERKNKALKEELERSYLNGVRKIWYPAHKDFHDYQKYYISYLESNDRNQEAMAELDTVLNYFEDRKIKNFNYAIQLDEMARFQYNLGFYNQMANSLDSAAKLYDELKKEKTFEYANHLLNRSRLYFVSGRFNDAEDYFRDAIRRAEKSESDNPFVSFARIENELAQLYIIVGEYSKAEKLIAEEIAFVKEHLSENSPLLIEPYNNKARLFLLSGDYTDAEAFNKKAIDISQSTFGRNSLKHSKSLEVQKLIALEKGDFEKAAEITEFVKRLQINLLGEKHILVANSIADLAVIKYNMGEGAGKSISELNRAASIIDEVLGSGSPQYANILKQKAFLYIREGNIVKAEPILDSAYNIWVEKVGDKSIEAADLEVLRGELLIRQKMFDEAEENYKDAMRVYKKIFNDDHPKYVRALSLLSRVFYIKKDYATCIKYLSESMDKYLNFIDRFFPSMSEREKNKYWSFVKGDFEFFNTVAIEVYEEEPKLIGDAYGFSLVTKAILLNSTLKVRQSISNSGNAELISRYNDWISRKEELSSAVSMNELDLQESGIDIESLKEQVENLEKELSRMSDIFSANLNQSRLDWKDVRKNLEDREAAIEIIRFRKYHESFTDTIIYAALIVTKETKKAPELIVLENGLEMENKYFKGYKNRIKFKLKDPVSYSIFWEPIDKHLQEVDKIYLSVDGVYNQINVETLQKPDGQYLIDDKNIILLSNTKEIVLKKGRLALRGKNSAVLFGNPVYHSSDGSLSPLPGAEKEVEFIYDYLKSNNWDCAVKYSEQATEMAVKSLRSPKVFHVATHGFFVPDVKSQKELELEELGLKQRFDNTLLKSGLVLDYGGDLLDKEKPINFNRENGLLTAYEAMNLNLDETDLVVLSACETGLGDVAAGEGVYGLQRSLIVAGARSVIMSLFKVSDEATQKLMLLFYEKWLSGMDKRTAFIEAKREMKKDYPEPLYWGAFVMIGFD